MDAERIDVDATLCTSVLDFYHDVLRAVRTPKGHGMSPDALHDSTVFGGMNGREPPYDIVISKLGSPEIEKHIDIVREVIAEGRAYLRKHYGHDAEISIRLDGQPPVH